jgi:MFS family permease
LCHGEDIHWLPLRIQIPDMTPQGIMYLDLPIITALVRLFPRQGRWSPLFGLLIICVALVMSSFATNVTQLIVTQGIFYAIGGSIAYSPSILYMDEWFVKKKGLAYGIMWSGTGLAGVIFPLLLEYLLSTYGYQVTLRLWAGLVFALTAPLAIFIKPRLPYSATTHTRSFDLRFVVSRTFLLHQLGNVVEAMGFFLPGIYLPTYARTTLGATPFQSAMSVLLLNVASVFGCVAMGGLIDRMHVTTCIFICSVGAAIGTFLIWGFSTTLPVLCVFCVLYGFFAGSYTSTWSGVMHDVAKNAGREGDSSESQDSHNSGSTVDPTMVLAFLSAGRGIGNVASGPLSEALIANMPWRGQAAGGYGSGYGGLIVFTGVTAILGGGSYIWRRVGWL